MYILYLPLCSCAGDLAQATRHDCDLSFFLDALLMLLLLLLLLILSVIGTVQKYNSSSIIVLIVL